jgi:hypothetical protein
MTDRTPTALDDAWEALRGDLMDGLPSEPLVHVPAVIVLHRPRIEAATKDRAEPRAEGLREAATLAMPLLGRMHPHDETWGCGACEAYTLLGAALRAALEEPTPGPQYTEDDPDWSAMVSPISDTDGGHNER